MTQLFNTAAKTLPVQTLSICLSRVFSSSLPWGVVLFYEWAVMQEKVTWIQTDRQRRREGKEGEYCMAAIQVTSLCCEETCMIHFGGCSVTSAADQVTSGAMMNTDGFASVIVRKLEIYWCLSRCSGHNHHNDLIITSAGCVVFKTSLPDEADRAPGQRGLCACENLSVTGPLSNSVCSFAEQMHLSVHLCQPQTFPSCLRLSVCSLLRLNMYSQYDLDVYGRNFSLQSVTVRSCIINKYTRKIVFTIFISLV